MPDNKRKPAIRFKKFTDAWEQRKALELFMSTTDKGHSELPVLSATQNRGMIKRDENGINIFHNRKNEEGYKRVMPGQFIIHLRSFQGGFAHSTIEGITSPAYTVFGFKEQEKHDDNFWKYIFTSKEFIRRLETVTYGIRDGRSISYDEFLTLVFTFPSKDEQSQVAQCFKHLDNLITLHQRKYDKLVNIKKSMLEKMFPRNGSNVPEIRFAGFTDAWEPRKLDLITDVRDGTHASPQYVVDGHPFVTSKNVKEGYINYDNIQFISDLDFEEINKRSKVDINDILMGMIGTIGNIAIVRENPDFAIKNVALIKDTGDVFYRYLYYCLQSKKVVNQLSENLDGGTQKFIALNKVRNLNIPLPSKKEQHKIGDYFEKLDNLITLHQREVEKLKNIKKSCLEKMFV